MLHNEATVGEPEFEDMLVAVLVCESFVIRRVSCMISACLFLNNSFSLLREI